VLVDGYKRVRALRRLGQDLVASTCWDLSEAEALVLDRLMRTGDGATALEQGWHQRDCSPVSFGNVNPLSIVLALGSSVDLKGLITHCTGVQRHPRRPNKSRGYDAHWVLVPTVSDSNHAAITLELFAKVFSRK
jgi:hypothetical protein